jgi:hypothetical protein
MKKARHIGEVMKPNGQMSFGVNGWRIQGQRTVAGCVIFRCSNTSAANAAGTVANYDILMSILTDLRLSEPAAELADFKQFDCVPYEDLNFL